MIMAYFPLLNWLFWQENRNNTPAIMTAPAIQAQFFPFTLPFPPSCCFFPVYT